MTTPSDLRKHRKIDAVCMMTTSHGRTQVQTRDLRKRLNTRVPLRFLHIMTTTRHPTAERVTRSNR